VASEDAAVAVTPPPTPVPVVVAANEDEILEEVMSSSVAKPRTLL